MKKIKNYIAIIGRTNTGKSTTFNNLLVKKKSIITSKKNTTIKSIQQKVNDNTLIVDTPGPVTKNKKNINNAIYYDIKNATIILITLDNLNLSTEDFFLLELIKKSNKRKILLLNKIDKIKNHRTILTFIEKLNKKYINIKEIIPISNKTKLNIDKLKTILNISKKIHELNLKINYKSFAKELMRELLLINFEKEIPYSTEINIQNTYMDANTEFIYINLCVNKINQKKIIIGKHGEKIKMILSKLKKEYLKTFKKIKNIKININIK